MRLPFRDQAFDAVTISFGLRNVADHQAALAEFRRVTRPGGRLVVCEFGHLPWPRLNAAYEAYLTGTLPAVARRLSGNPAAYEYLAESIQDWPAQPELARRIAAARVVGSTLAGPEPRGGGHPSGPPPGLTSRGGFAAQLG